MATTGYSLPADGKVVCSFAGSSVPGSIVLEHGFYVLNVSMTDANNPGLLTLTDPQGGVFTYSQHGSYPLMVGTYSTAPYSTWAVTGTGLDQVSVVKPRGQGWPA